MRVLLTGGNGFLGAWIAKRLLARGFEVVVFDVVENRRLMNAIAGPAAAQRHGPGAIEQVPWILGDIVDGGAVLAASRGCDAIIHLAGILTPDCKANPVRGAQINLIGTLNVFEAARQLGIQRVLYTSSAGVYGPDDGHIPKPTTHYGTFKLACEGSARAYLADHGLASIGFRPFIVYGPGRETGISAGPSLACRAAARGEAYVIPYSGRSGLVFVDDVAAAYEAALLRQPDGAHVFNNAGETVSNEDVVAAIKQVVPDARITVSGPPLSIIPEIDRSNIEEVLPGLPKTGLADGIRQTVALYRET
jgi:UDP-glucose 4-epimerase